MLGLHPGCGLWPAAVVQPAEGQGDGKTGSLPLGPAASVMPDQTGFLHDAHIADSLHVTKES